MPMHWRSQWHAREASGTRKNTLVHWRSQWHTVKWHRANGRFIKDHKKSEKEPD
jgi:hypothetical protein